MSVAGLMFHVVNIWRQVQEQGRAAQQVVGYDLVYDEVAAFVQPADSQVAFYYSQRGFEDVHNVYISDTSLDIRRNDIVEFGTRQFHVIGIQNGLELNIYKQITVNEYPEGAKKMLNREQY